MDGIGNQASDRREGRDGARLSTEQQQQIIGKETTSESSVGAGREPGRIWKIQAPNVQGRSTAVLGFRDGSGTRISNGTLGKSFSTGGLGKVPEGHLDWQDTAADCEWRWPGRDNGLPLSMQDMLWKQSGSGMFLLPDRSVPGMHPTMHGETDSMPGVCGRDVIDGNVDGKAASQLGPEDGIRSGNVDDQRAGLAGPNIRSRDDVGTSSRGQSHCAGARAGTARDISNRVPATSPGRRRGRRGHRGSPRRSSRSIRRRQRKARLDSSSSGDSRSKDRRPQKGGDPWSCSSSDNRSKPHGRGRRKMTQAGGHKKKRKVRSKFARKSRTKVQKFDWRTAQKGQFFQKTRRKHRKRCKQRENFKLQAGTYKKTV